uniref:Small RNA 2'-O-methyltransferase n=1 Tax=Cacopsylla melanoneura TaxID=428564 RepID=A0A8D8XMU0_9HEMI
MIVFFHMLYYVSSIIWNRVVKPKLFAIDSNESEESESKQVEKRTQFYELERPGNDNSTEYDDDYDPTRDVCVYDLLSGKLTFVPPLYIQRYQAVMKVLTQDQHAGRVHKIAEFGCAEFAMFKYYKKLPSVNRVLFVDIDEELLVHKCERVMPLTCDYLIQRDSELSASLFCGDVSVPDERMNDVDVVVAIELIEHLYPPTLENVPYNLFGVIQPYLIIITTPNGEFNWLFDDYVEGTFRHDDHKFEWTREQFQCWAENLVTRYPMYTVQISGIGPPPACKSEAQFGHCSQMALFTRTGERNVQNIPTHVGEPYKLIKTVTYPVKPPETRSKEQILFDEMTYLLFTWKLDLVPLNKLYASLSEWCASVDELKHLLEKNCRRLVYKPEDGEYYLIDDSRTNHGSSGSLSDDGEELLGQYDYEANRERDEMLFENENQTHIRMKTEATHHSGLRETQSDDVIEFKGDSFNECWDSWDVVEPPASSSTQIAVGETADLEEGKDENGMGGVSGKINETIDIASEADEDERMKEDDENERISNEVEIVESFAKKEADILETVMNATKEVEKAGKFEDKSLQEREETENKKEKQEGVKIRCANLEQYIRDSLRDDAGGKRRQKRTSKSATTSRPSTKCGGGKSTNQRTMSSSDLDVTTKSTNDRASSNDVTNKSTNERTCLNDDVTQDNDADVDTSEDSSSEDEETIARNEKMKNLSQEKKKLEEEIEKLSQDLTEHTRPTQGNGKLIQDIEEENSGPAQRYIESRDADLRTREDVETKSQKQKGRSSQTDMNKELREDSKIQSASLGIDKRSDVSNPTKDVEHVSNVPIEAHVNAVVKTASTTDVKPNSHTSDVKTHNSQTPVNSSTTGFNLDSIHLPINSTTLSTDYSATGGFDSSSSLNLSSILVDTTSDGLSSSNTQFEVSYNLNSHITEYDSSSLDDDIVDKTGTIERRAGANGTGTGGNELKMSRDETDSSRQHVEERTVNKNTKSINKLKDITNKSNQNGTERKLGEKQGSNQMDIKLNQDSVMDKADIRKEISFHKEQDRRGENSVSHQETTTNVLKEKSLNKEINKLGHKLENLSLYSPEKLGRTTDWVNQIPNQSKGVDGKEKCQNVSLSEKQKATRRRRSLKLESGENSEDMSRRKSLGAIGKKYQETRGLENEKGDYVRQPVYQVEVASLENRERGDFVNQSTEQTIEDVILANGKPFDNEMKSRLDHRETSETVSRKFVDDLCTRALETIKDIDTGKDKLGKRSTVDIGQDNCANKTNVETKTDSVDKVEKEDFKQLPDLVKSSKGRVEHVREGEVRVENKSKSTNVENNNEVDVFRHELVKDKKSTDVLRDSFDSRTDRVKEFSKLTDRVEIMIEKSKHAAKVDIAKDPTKGHERTNEIQQHVGKDVTKEVSESKDGVEEIRNVSKDVTKGTNDSENAKEESEDKDGTNNESDQSSADEDDYLSCADTTSLYKTGHLDSSDTMSMFSCRSGDTQFETASEYQTSYYSGSDDSDATLVESENETCLNDEDTDHED